MQRITIFDDLSEQQRMLLTYVGYLFYPVEEDKFLRQVTKLCKWKKEETQAVLKAIAQKGYIDYRRTGYWSSVDVSIKEEWLLPLLCQMYIDHPEWPDMFRRTLSVRYKIEQMQALMLALAEGLVKGEKMSMASLPDSDYLAGTVGLVEYWFTKPVFIDCMQYLPDELIAICMPRAIGRLINNDYGSGMMEYVAIEQTLQLQNKNRRQLRYQLMLGCYLEQGEVPACYSADLTQSQRMWQAVAIEAIQAMTAGHYMEATKLFAEALDKIESGTIQMGIMRSRAECFPYPLLNFLHVIALAKCNGVMTSSRFASMSRKDFSEYSAYQAALVVARMIHSSDIETPNEAIIVGFEQAPTAGWIAQKLSLMLCQWLKIDSRKLKLKDARNLCDPDKIQYCAWATQFASRELMTLSFKPVWERAIEMILREEEKKSHPTTRMNGEDPRTVRIGYFLTGNHLEIREQKRLKSGKWSAGKLVSDSSFQYGSTNYDEVDESIKRLYKSHRYSAPNYREVLPLLVGTDKLFVGRCAPYAQCNVREEKPFLSANIGKNGITLASNVPLHELDDREESHVLYNQVTDDEVCIFRVPVRVRTYLRALLRVGTFPLEAEPQLKALFVQMGKIVEIHSEMVEGGSTLPSVEGDSSIVLQASSERGGYRLAAVVRPLPEGRLTVVPGAGDQHVFDQTPDGSRFQVVRNKKAEKRNVSPLLEQMEQLDCDTVSPCVWHLDAYDLLELMEWLPEQGEQYEMEWPEGDRIRLSTANPASWNISLQSHGGWFDVEGEIPIDEDTILSVGQLLTLMGEGHGRFVKLGEGQYLGLTDSLRRQLSRLDAVAQSVRGKTRIPSLAAGLIGDALYGELDIAHPKQIDELRQRIRHSQDLQAEVPEGLNATLRDYQEEGFRWIDRLSSWGAGACLADDMGLGKTVQTIAFLLHKQTEGASLVVAPASVAPNWRKELARFAPALRVVVLNDLPSAERHEAVEQSEAGCVVVSTYGLLISEEEAVTAKSWNVVCLDEAHSIKNASTKTSAVCMKLQAQHRLILTGTPIQNHLGELWNLFQFINPGLLGSFEQFTNKYIRPIEDAHDKDRQQQLKRIVQPFMLRRTKQEVIAELPDKQEINLPVQLSTEEMAIYEFIRMEAKRQLEADSEGGNLSVNTLSMITRLRMAACSASLANKNWAGTSSKLEAFCDLVSEICTAGNRILVFSQFTSFLEMAKVELEHRGMKDYFYLDGSTPIKRRSEMVDAFQKGKCPLFIISLKAGGLGLNLTGANYVIHLDPWWNPAIEQQATDRAYRIGQEQKVTVYHLISEHTIEEKILRLHQTKRDLADGLLEGTDMSHKLSAADLLDMIGGN